MSTIAGRFHARDGICFQRDPNTGSVTILRTSGHDLGMDPLDAATPVAWSVVLTVEAWASIVSSMTHEGENAQTFTAALAFALPPAPAEEL